MEPGEALQLLGRLIGEQRVETNMEAAAKIIHLCDRLPLALRIAGGQISRDRHGSLTSYTKRLSDERHRLDQLQLDHKEVRGSFELSYTGLPSASTHLFRLLGRLPGVNFGDEEAGCLLGGKSGALGCSDIVLRRALGPLVTDSLVEVIGPNRYRLHDLVRLFSQEKLAQIEHPDMRDDAWHRVVLWYVEASRVMSESLSPETLEDVYLPERQTCVVLEEGQTLFQRGLDWFDVEYDNLKVALDDLFKHEQWELVWLLASHLVRYLDLRALWADWRWSQDLALAASRAACDRQVEAALLINLGNLFLRQNLLKDAGGHFKQALTLYRNLDDRSGESAVLGALGNTFAARGLWDEALLCYEEQLAMRRELGDDPADAATSINLANIYIEQGRWDEAVVIYEENLQVARDLGDHHREALVLMNLGTVRDKQGDHATAIGLYDKSLLILRQLGDRYNKSNALFNQGLAYLQQDDDTHAIQCLEQAIEISHDLNDHVGEVQALMQLSIICEHNDDREKATALRHAAEAIMAEVSQ